MLAMRHLPWSGFLRNLAAALAVLHRSVVTVNSAQK